MGKQCQTLFLGGSRITVDSDWSHEIKRHLLLVRKAMTNLDSILRSRDIAFPTEVHIVKAMVFPVVMYTCESWTIKKAECQQIDAFVPEARVRNSTHDRSCGRDLMGRVESDLRFSPWHFLSMYPPK